MQRVVDEAVQLVPAAEGAGICLVAADGWLTYVTVAGSLTGFEGFRLAQEGSMHGLALRTGRVQRCDDAATDMRVDHVAAEASRIGSMMALPVTRNGEPIGAVTVMSAQKGAFSDPDATLLESLAGFLSLTITAATDSTELGDTPSTYEATGSGPAVSERTAMARFITHVLAPSQTVDQEMHDRITRTIQHRSFRSVAQPIVEMTTGELIGVEALTRFAELLPPPGDWFAAAHDVGLAEDLEYATALSALAMLADLPEPLYLSFNTGPGLLASTSLHDLLATHDLSRVVIELTEHVIVTDYEQLSVVLHPLRSAGARLAIDDTGAGFASLSHILKLAPEIIKLDRSLVEGIDRDTSRRILVTSLARLGIETGATVIAEGVQTESEAATLIDLGVSHGQGFLFAHPTSIGKLPSIVARPGKQIPDNVRRITR